MKKTTGKIISLIIAVMLTVSALAGCELFEVNVDKDMAQVVAEVQVTEVPTVGETKVDYSVKEPIYKRELISGFVSYGYNYVNSYGYTVSQTYELILDNLINNKVILQYARVQLKDKYNKTYTTAAESLSAYDNLKADASAKEYAEERIAYANGLYQFVTELQVKEAVYNAKSTMENLVKSLDEETQDNEEEEKEDETFTPRDVPTVKAVSGTALDAEYAEKNGLEDKAEEDLDENELAAYEAWQLKKFTDFKITEATTVSRKAAVRSFVEAFTEYGVLREGEYEYLEGKQLQYDLTQYSYYADLVIGNLESFIITNYEAELKKEAEAGIEAAALYEEFETAFATQKANYSTDLAAYETALDEATEDSYVLYNPDLGGAKYGYVANILIGFSDEATAALTAYKAANTDHDAVNKYRDSLLNTLVAKDLRTTWIQSGYAEPADKTNPVAADYTFKDEYLKSDNAILSKFHGSFIAPSAEDYAKTKEVDAYFFDDADSTWKWGKKKEDDFTLKFDRVVADEYKFADFLTNVFDAALGTTTAPVSGEIYDYEGDLGDFSEDVQNVIDDLTFAFSTDPGGLNAYLGYVYSPKTSATTYVKEFAEAAKLAVEGGKGTYYIVATDYGYHIIICTHVVEPTAADAEAYVGGQAAFTADLENKDSVPYRFRKAKIDANVEKIVSDVVTFNISKYVEDEVKEEYINRKPLKNLIEETEAE